MLCLARFRVNSHHEIGRRHERHRAAGAGAGHFDRHGFPRAQRQARRQRIHAQARPGGGATVGLRAQPGGTALAQGTTRSVGFMIELDQETRRQQRLLLHGRLRRGAERSGQARARSARSAVPGRPGSLHLSRALRVAQCRRRHILAATQRVDPRIDCCSPRGFRSSRSGAATTGSGYSWIDLDFEGSVATRDRSVGATRASAHRRNGAVWRR